MIHICSFKEWYFVTEIVLTYIFFQVKSSASDSVMTFAHEVGHNMGAEHDEDAGCARG